MRVQDEDTCEAEYWDEYLREFGRAAYIEARYQAPNAVELEPGAYDSDDLDRIHSLSHERLRGALVENFDAKQAEEGFPPVPRGWAEDSIGGSRSSSELSTLKRTPLGRRTPVGRPPRNVGPTVALIRTPADDVSTDPAAARTSGVHRR